MKTFRSREPCARYASAFSLSSREVRAVIDDVPIHCATRCAQDFVSLHLDIGQGNGDLRSAATQWRNRWSFSGNVSAIDHCPGYASAGILNQLSEAIKMMLR